MGCRIKNREAHGNWGEIQPTPNKNKPNQNGLGTFAYTLITQMTIFICLSNFFRIPEKCLIIFPFCCVSRNGRASIPHLHPPPPPPHPQHIHVYIVPRYFIQKTEKQSKKIVCPNAEKRPSYIYILRGMEHCFSFARQKIRCDF